METAADVWRYCAKVNDETLAYERGRIGDLLKQRYSLKARAERAEARLQQLLEHGYPTWSVKGAPKSQWHERDAYAAVDHVLNVAEMYFSGARRSSLLLARESWEALFGRTQDAELRAAAAEAELARLRAHWASAVAEVAAMGAEPDATGQVLTPRRSPATMAALREVAEMLAKAQPAEVSDG